MAASFQSGGGAPKPSAREAKRSTNKIPNIRLSFITAQDQAKFETLFKSAVGDGQTTMSGEKARDLLLRSRLDGDSLSRIWTLADTTRSGQLHFPEFALAMYLCNLKLTGKSLPSTLPENVKNEVSSMVDIINFSVVEEAAGGSAPSGNAPDFSSGRLSTASPPAIQHPQPQPSNSQLLSTQMTGYPGPQGGFLGQSQGLAPQQTAFPGPGVQQTGYTGPRPPMPPMPTGFQPGLSPSNAGGMVAPLNSQPTGRPGQWGLVNTPATGLPNIDALQARMMPQQGREQQNYTTTGLQGNAVIPWAITKDEKTMYDGLFRAWDGLGKGYIGGDQAIEIFGQSGLDKPDLERVWTLADHGNKGRLDLDEFAVAMHLIYRKLNGYPLPNQLPAELVPPSTRNLNNSLGRLKSMLHEESDFRKNSGAALLPQKTGVSYLKSHSFRSGSGSPGGGARKDATVFKNNDEEIGYRSSARRRLGAGGSPRPESPSSVTSNEDLSLEQLRKKIREKQVVLDALDFKDETHAEEDDILDRNDRREAEELYRRIRRIQEDIDSHPDAVAIGGDSDAERRALKRQLQNLTDKIPDLASQARKAEKAVADARLELFRLKDANAHPGSASTIVGTGPGGAVTESDRLKARAKAMMQQRTAALTGKKVDVVNDDGDAARRLEEESSKTRTEKENNERMVRDVEESVREFARGVEDNLKEGAVDSTTEHEKRRWEDGLGVEDEVKDFIFDLQRSSRAARTRAQDRRGGRAPTQEPVRAEAPPTSVGRTDSPISTSRTATPPTTSGTPTGGGGSYASYKTPEERAAFIKQQAEQRMAERLAALGIKAPSKPGETAAQKHEREQAERAARRRQAEEEDARREAERQARIAEEQGAPPPAVQSPGVDAREPSSPPTRKGKTEEKESARKAEEERLQRERDEQEKAAQELEKRAQSEEAELARESEEREARNKALEEQVRQGRLKKEEAKRRKKAALAEEKEKEAKLAARRAEIEAARQREEKLQKELDAMNDETSSDEDDGPQQITPQASTPTHAASSQELESAAAAAPAAAATSPVTDKESRNPFFRMLSQTGESSASPGAAAAAALPSPPPAAPPPPPSQADANSKNPFYRMTQEGKAAAPAAAPTPPQPFTRKTRDDDDWGSDHDEEEEDSDDERPGGTSAAQLASILFGTMGPPRPLSAAGDKNAAASPTISSPSGPPPPEASSSPAPAAPPPPPPPMPTAPSGAAPPPPTAPPPPPMPSIASPPAAPDGAPPPPPPIPGMAPPPPPPPPPASGASSAPAPSAGGGGGRPAGFLGEIQAGRSLKKATTRDKSGAAVAGRVLD